MYIQYICSCLCWVDCFITLMKHSCTACQMCALVSIGEMSFSLPPFEIFSPKKEMETLFACTGEGGRGRGGCWWKWERERESGWGERGRSHLDLLYGHFHWRKKWEGDPFGFIGSRRRTGRWQQAERFGKESLIVSHDTNRENKFGSVGMCTSSLILCLAINMTNMSCVFCEEDLIIRKKHHTDQRLSFNNANPYSVQITQYPYFNV